MLYSSDSRSTAVVQCFSMCAYAAHMAFPLSERVCTRHGNTIPRTEYVRIWCAVDITSCLNVCACTIVSVCADDGQMSNPLCVGAYIIVHMASTCLNVCAYILQMSFLVSEGIDRCQLLVHVCIPCADGKPSV